MTLQELEAKVKTLENEVQRLKGIDEINICKGPTAFTSKTGWERTLPTFLSIVPMLF